MPDPFKQFMSCLEIDRIHGVFVVVCARGAGAKCVYENYYRLCYVWHVLIVRKFRSAQQAKSRFCLFQIPPAPCRRPTNLPKPQESPFLHGSPRHKLVDVRGEMPCNRPKVEALEREREDGDPTQIKMHTKRCLFSVEIPEIK